MSKQLDALLAKLREEHPNHCRSCGGFGGKLVEYNGGLWEPDSLDFEECPHCLQRLKHPLSGEAISDEEREGWGDAMLHDEEAVPSPLPEIYREQRREEDDAAYQAACDGYYDDYDY